MKQAACLCILISLLLTGCAAPGGDTGNILHITTANFVDEVLESDKPVLLDFYADWCGPCQMMAPHLEEIAAERTDIKVGKIDVDVESDLVATYGIEAMPTLIVIKDGEVAARAVGYRSKADILALL